MLPFLSLLLLGTLIPVLIHDNKLILTVIHSDYVVLFHTFINFLETFLSFLFTCYFLRESVFINFPLSWRGRIISPLYSYSFLLMFPSVLLVCLLRDVRHLTRHKQLTSFEEAFRNMHCFMCISPIIPDSRLDSKVSKPLFYSFASCMTFLFWPVAPPFYLIFPCLGFRWWWIVIRMTMSVSWISFILTFILSRDSWLLTDGASMSYCQWQSD